MRTELLGVTRIGRDQLGQEPVVLNDVQGVSPMMLARGIRCTSEGICFMCEGPLTKDGDYATCWNADCWNQGIMLYAVRTVE